MKEEGKWNNKDELEVNVTGVIFSKDKIKEEITKTEDFIKAWETELKQRTEKIELTQHQTNLMEDLKLIEEYKTKQTMMAEPNNEQRIKDLTKAIEQQKPRLELRKKWLSEAPSE